MTALMIVAPGVPLPSWLARLCWAASLEKRLGHKFVRRVPTGDPKHPYRYYYNLTGGTGKFGHHNVVEGSAFKVADGHLHVRSVSKHHVEVEHDETGQVHTMHRDHFADLLHSHHADEVKKHESRRAHRDARIRDRKQLKSSRLPKSNRKIADELEDAIGHDFGTIDMHDTRLQDTLRHYLPPAAVRQVVKETASHGAETAFKTAIAALITQAGRRSKLKTWRDLLDAKVGDRGHAGSTSVIDVLREIGDQIDDPALARAHAPTHAIDAILNEDEADHWKDQEDEARDSAGDDRDGVEPEDGGDDSWDFGKSLLAKSLANVPWWVGALLMKACLEKGAGHKYVRRVPTGDRKRPYRYYYRVTGGGGLAHDDEIKQGAAFAFTDAGKLGHFHVEAVDGNKVTIKHDESGTTHTIHRDALRDMLHEHHASAITAARSSARQTVVDAEKHGSPAQQERAYGRRRAVEENLAPRPKEKIGGQEITFRLDRRGIDAGMELVRVNVRALDRAWRKDGNFYLTPDGGRDISGRRQQFLEYIDKNPHNVEASTVNYDASTGKVAFSDGRHRFATMRDQLDADHVWVAVDAAEAKVIAEKFGKAPPSVPDHVMSQLDRHVRTLKDVATRLEEGRALDTKHGGGGRYEAEVAHHFVTRPGSSLFEASGAIENFRELAKKNGVDADEVLAELGGTPNTVLSEKGAKYAHNQGWATKIKASLGAGAVPGQPDTKIEAPPAPAEKPTRAAKAEKPKKGKFLVLTRDGGAERDGHVLGDFAAHKEKGEYSHSITHIPSGYKVTTAKNKDAALEAIQHFHKELPPGSLKNTRFGEVGPGNFERLAAASRVLHDRDPEEIARKAKAKAHADMVAAPFVAGELSTPTREALIEAHGGKEPTVDELKAVRATIERFRRDKSARDHDSLGKVLGVYPGSDAGKRMIREIDHHLEARVASAGATIEAAREARKKWLGHQGTVGDPDRTAAMRAYNAIVDKLPAETRDRFLQEVSDAEEAEIGRKMRAGRATEDAKPTVVRGTVGTPPAPRVVPGAKDETTQQLEALVTNPPPAGQLSPLTRDLLMRKASPDGRTLPGREELSRHISAMRKLVERKDGEKLPVPETMAVSKFIGYGAISQAGRAIMREIVAYHDSIPATEAPAAPVAPAPAPPPVPVAKKTGEEIAAEVRARDRQLQRDLDAKKPPKTAKDVFERHDLHTLARDLPEGKITPDALRSRFAAFKANKEQIVDHLKGLTKDELVKLAGYHYRDVRKDRLVDAAYSSLAQMHNPAEAFTWSPTSESLEAALDRQMAAVTDDTIAKYKAAHDARKTEREKRIESIKNPQTLSDFQTLARLKGGEHKLEPHELARHDDLVAEDARSRAEKNHREQHEKRQAFMRSTIERPMSETSAKVIAGKHTKKGHDIWTVQLADRVSRDEYKALESRAKQLGGYYSSFRGNGAVPGFIFPKAEHANTFAQHVGGGPAPATSDVPAPPTVEPVAEPLGPLHGTAPQRLREQATNAHARADDSLGAQRQENTERRARMAANATSSARKEKAHALTMEAIAAAQESGEARHLWGVSTRAHVDLLEDAIQQAKYNRVRAMPGKHDDEAWRAPPTAEDAAAAKFPYPSVHKDHVRSLAHATKDVAGAKQAAKRLLGHVEKLGENEWRFRADQEQHREDLAAVAAAAEKSGVDRFGVEVIKEELGKHKRAREGMGLESPAQLRAAAREYQKLRVSPDGETKLSKLKRALVGQKIPGYFPTPKSLGRRVLELADVQPGQKVLEPSAGSGALADLAREAGGDVDVVERQSSLREILGEKGHNVVGHDTYAHEGEYDHVIMNPAFEDDQDIDQVKHAFTHQVKDGGTLTAIVSRGAVDERSGSKKRKDFQAWLKDHGAHIEDAPDGAFAGVDSERKTGVYTSVIKVDKPHLSTPEGRVYQMGTGSKTWWVRDAGDGKTHQTPFEAKHEALAHASLNEQTLRQMNPERLPKKLRGEVTLEKSMIKSDMMNGPTEYSWTQRYKGTSFGTRALRIEADSMRRMAAINDEQRKLRTEPGCFQDPRIVKRMAELDIERTKAYAEYESAKEKLAIDCIEAQRETLERTGDSPLEKSLAGDRRARPKMFTTPDRLNVVTSSEDRAEEVASDSMRVSSDMSTARKAIREARVPRTKLYGGFAKFDGPDA